MSAVETIIRQAEQIRDLKRELRHARIAFFLALAALIAVSWWVQR